MVGFYTNDACQSLICVKEREENSPLQYTSAIYQNNHYCRKCSTYFRIEVHFSVPAKTKFRQCPCCGERVRLRPASARGRAEHNRLKALRRGKINERSMETGALIYDELLTHLETWRPSETYPPMLIFLQQNLGSLSIDDLEDMKTTLSNLIEIVEGTIEMSSEEGGRPAVTRD